MSHNTSTTTTQPSLADAILAQAADALIYAGRDGQIALWNAAAERDFGFSAAEAIGQSLDLIIPEHLRVGHWRGWDAASTSTISARAMPRSPRSAASTCGA